MEPVARPQRPPSSRASSEDGRFPPGSLLVDRYRVISLVGRGGMGEVYRASDLKLNQPVALKFLPQGTAGRSDLLERFHGEVRIARQVSHPNGFLVGAKWPPSARRVPPKGTIPRRLLAMATMGGRRVLCAVPTDVEDARFSRL